MKKRSLFGRIISGIWSGIDGFRKLLHLLLLLFLFAIFVGALSGTAPLLPERAALLIQPVGAIVEELEGDPFDRALAELLDEAQPQTVLQDIVDALEYARDDDGDGFCEVHVNTMEGFWSLLRSWLRPHRGISQAKLPLYLSFFEFVHNAKVRGKQLLPELIRTLVT